MPEPSALDYARYFRLTQDYANDDPLDHLNTPKTLLREQLVSQTSDENYRELVETFEKAAQDHGSLVTEESLAVSQSVASYLKMCSARSESDVNHILDKLLPDPYRLRKLKLGMPLLVVGGGDVAKDARRIREGVNLDAMLQEIMEGSGDEKDISVNNGQLISSNVSIEMFNWSQCQWKAAMKREKLDVSLETMKHLEASSNTSIDTKQLEMILESIYPNSDRNHNIAAPSIDQADFEIEGIQPCSETERGVPSQLSEADGEQNFVQNIQEDEEIDGIFRQFTNHHSNNNLVIQDIQNTKFGKEANQIKINDEQQAELTAALEISVSEDQELEFTQLKIALANMTTSTHPVLPELDMSTLDEFKFKSQDLSHLKADLDQAPFHIPQMNETLHDSKPPNLVLLDKYLRMDRNILSSDKILWKEPGLRVLDFNDAEIEELVAKNYEIEDRIETTFTTPQPVSTWQTEDLASFNEHQPQRELTQTSEEVETNGSRRDSAHSEGDFGAIVSVKREAPSPKIMSTEMPFAETKVDTFTRVGSSPIEVEPIMKAGAGYQEVSKGSITTQNQLYSPSISRVTTKRKNKADQHMGDVLSSLLPKKKRMLYAFKVGTEGIRYANDPLSDFLDLRGKQFKFDTDRALSKPSEIANDPIISTQDYTKEDRSCDGQSSCQSLSTAVKPLEQAVTPAVKHLDSPCTVVVNNTLLQAKPLLIQFLEESGSTNLTLIYRDLDIHQDRGPDLILSPRTCLIMINLPSLNQRPLPGHKSPTNLSSAHDRVKLLNEQYTNVVLLIYYTITSDPGTQNKTLLTQASFAAFCASISQSQSRDVKRIQPCWLPCTDLTSVSSIVNAWIWQIIELHAYRIRASCMAPSTLSVVSPLIQDETIWELFLRKAGLNPFSAQIVIGSLKKPNSTKGTSLEEQPSWGLRRLVSMSPRERIDRFASVIGSDVVERLNKVLSNTDGMNC